MSVTRGRPVTGWPTSGPRTTGPSLVDGYLPSSATYWIFRTAGNLNGFSTSCASSAAGTPRPDGITRAHAATSSRLPNHPPEHSPSVQSVAGRTTTFSSRTSTMKAVPMQLAFGKPDRTSVSTASATPTARGEHAHRDRRSIPSSDNRGLGLRRTADHQRAFIGDACLRSGDMSPTAPRVRDRNRHKRLEISPLQLCSVARTCSQPRHPSVVNTRQWPARAARAPADAASRARRW